MCTVICGSNPSVSADSVFRSAVAAAAARREGVKTRSSGVMWKVSGSRESFLIMLVGSSEPRLLTSGLGGSNESLLLVESIESFLGSRESRFSDPACLSLGEEEARERAGARSSGSEGAAKDSLFWGTSSSGPKIDSRLLKGRDFRLGEG